MKHCYDALEALEYLNKMEVDLIFLDLNMPVIKGFEFLKTLKYAPKVIVTTAYKEFALEGYEHNIADYLLKPFGFERFLKALNRAVAMPIRQNPVPAANSADSNLIFVQSNKKYIQLDTSRIICIEAYGNYTRIITTSETLTIREKFSSSLELLPESEFIQVHKSFAVARRHIKSIEGNQIFAGEIVVPIGKMYRHNIALLLK